MLATLLQTKELDESMLDALGILPQRKQHKKFLLLAKEAKICAGNWIYIKYRERVMGLILVSPVCKSPSWSEWLCNKLMSNVLYYYGMCNMVKEMLLQRYFSKEVCGSAHVPQTLQIPIGPTSIY
ncbi:hypothetical protein H6P81_016293 [Aristolochia fimbriata]|uniref:Uncharacterized protein n=1 Tax=Aristolochia fimbriata TaxID=158543 RepID=A0AAV7E801_ARIFI|nr:hypothetical protein H6P81_016293 [Aristolochia fimbriata]